ncbi:protein disulfide-isomerase TMX3-like isoform X2 [Xiphophorus couchianus]|uniref:protein disulfide-isomerase TMX3-like isoform X2 n=1 Tax=Xiphophorus couchianus TaxID=32473 RepID=UPI001016F7AE|nr:protein disulfide-isomerase TMX3-like isoform X2 [Xiphophorus couchianus]
MAAQRSSILLAGLLLVPVLLGSAFVEELDDTFMETTEPEEIWLIQFYAPWCSFCKQLDPVWHQIGSELRSLGSPVRVGKSDATVNTGLAREFKVRNYPAILMLKNDVKFNYPGSRTKEAIMDFADRVSGPLVRSLSSTRLFQHAVSHHDVLVLYVGATSELKGNLTAAAEELIVHTYFFSASREILPQEVTLTSLPAVLLLKDGTYFIYDEEQDGDLKSWIKRERFPNFFLIDGYTLYAMGESGKLVLLALLEERHLCEENLRYKHLVEKVATEHKDTYGRSEILLWFHGGQRVHRRTHHGRGPCPLPDGGQPVQRWLLPATSPHRDRAAAAGLPGRRAGRQCGGSGRKRLHSARPTLPLRGQNDTNAGVQGCPGARLLPDWLPAGGRLCLLLPLHQEPTRFC